MLSAVVLFELLLNNNWHVLMEGFRSATANVAVRVYFIVFVLIAEVCLWLDYIHKCMCQGMGGRLCV